MQDGINRLFKKYEIKATLKGFPVCPFFDFGGKDYQDHFLKGCYRNGVSLYHVPYINYSHKEKDIQEALEKIENNIRELKREKPE